MVIALVAVAGVLAVKWLEVKQASPAGPAISVTGRSATEDATHAPGPGSEPTATPVRLEAGAAAVSAGAQNLPVSESPGLAVSEAGIVEAEEVLPEPAVADLGTGQAHDQGLAANISGVFPRVLIEPGVVVPVTVAFPGAAGGAVVVSVMDGGSLDGRDVSREMQLDEQGRLQFAFHAGASPGIYRVTLRRGGSRQMLQFWVGPPQEIVRTPLPKATS